jgi:hypothetical protein
MYTSGCFSNNWCIPSLEAIAAMIWILGTPHYYQQMAKWEMMVFFDKTISRWTNFSPCVAYLFENAHDTEYSRGSSNDGIEYVCHIRNAHFRQSIVILYGTCISHGFVHANMMDLCFG